VTGAEALALSERLVEVAPGRAATWSLRGAVSSRIGADLGLLPDSAAIIREAYARSIALEPRLPWDRMAWAVYERSLGEPDRARALVMAAVAEEPNLIAGWAFLAQLDLKQGIATVPVDTLTGRGQFSPTTSTASAQRTIWRCSNCRRWLRGPSLRPRHERGGAAWAWCRAGRSTLGASGPSGGRRTERFRTWLADAGARVTVVRGGSTDAEHDEDWGRVIVVRDPLGFYRDADGGRPLPLVPRAPNPLRRIAAHLLLVPEPTALWAWRARRSPAVRRAVDEADVVLASSPPESSLVAAADLARAGRTGLVVDLRDGWLDDPMIPLATLPIQRARHARLERSVVRRSAAVFVTSEVWREMLVERYPAVRDRCVVLTNTVPDATAARRPPSEGPIELVYPGRLGASRRERSVEQLMVPTLRLAPLLERPVRLVFLGHRPPTEADQILAWHGRCGGVGWQLDVSAEVPEAELSSRLQQAHGMVVLSASRASLPAKLFDALASGRPILAVAPAGSALHRLAASVSRLSVVELDEPPSPPVLEHFVAGLGAPPDHSVPPHLKATWQRRRFLESIVLTGRPHG
jgi:hypothetical protein